MTDLLTEARLRHAHFLTRRHFLKTCSTGLGAAALGSMLGCGVAGGSVEALSAAGNPLLSRPPHFVPSAKRVIFLHMAGGPSQLELFDYKPELARLNGEPCPPSLLEGKRFSFMRQLGFAARPVLHRCVCYGIDRARCEPVMIGPAAKRRIWP